MDAEIKITYIPSAISRKKGNVICFCLFAGLRIRIRIDLRNCMKMNLDPDQHYREEQDPDPHRVKIQEFLF